MATTYDKNSAVEITSLYIEDEANNLMPFLMGLSIFEDMFTTFMSAQVTLLDYSGVYEQLKLQGWEKLTIGFKTNRGGDFELFMKEFRIYKIANGNDSTSGTAKRTYTLFLISEQAYNDQTMKISRSFKDMKESEVVELVAKNSLKCEKIEVEPSKYTRSFVAPNWSPLRVIDYMAQTAVRANSYEAVNFLFYENIEGFYFQSLDKLMEAEASEPPITYQLVLALPDRPGVTRQARRVRLREGVDMIKNSNAGVFGAKHIGVDTLYKKIEEFDYDYNKEFESQVNIDGTNKRITKNAPVAPEQVVLIRPYNSKLQGDNADNSEKHVMKRLGMMALWNNYVIEAEIEGDSTLKLGTKISVELPSYDPENPGLDRNLSGHYLITGIHHYFENMKHNQVLTLRKPMLKGAEGEDNE